MKVKKICAIVLFAGLVLMLISCPGVVPSIVQGYLMSVDVDGHFTEDLVYNGGLTTYTYRKDGTFLVQSVDTAGNITGGTQGTYTWNQSSLELELTYAKYYSTTNNAWEDYIDGKTQTITYYFSSQRLDYAYALVANTDNTFSFQEKTVNENGNTTTWTITVEIRETTFIYDEVYTIDDNSGTRTYGSDVHVEGSIDAIYPAGAQWRQGETVTVSITQTSGQTRSWDTGTSAWSSWSTMTSFIKELRTYTHMGTYVIERTGSDWIPLR